MARSVNQKECSLQVNLVVGLFHSYSTELRNLRVLRSTAPNLLAAEENRSFAAEEIKVLILACY